MTGLSSTNASTHDADKRAEVEQVEVGQTPYPKKVTFGQKAKRHCARFWWLHLIIFCVTFLITSLCLVYVALPKIAQKGVDDSSLEFTELMFLDPTNDSISLTQRGILYSPSIFTPTLDAFNASLFLVENGAINPSPILTIPMPSIHALHPQGNVSIENTRVQVNSQDGLASFATQVLRQENLTSALSGKTSLHLGALPVVPINYNSQSTYKGLNGLFGFNVTGIKINLAGVPGQPDLKPITGFAVIPNPSVMTIAMGNVTLSLSTDKAGIIGNATINDMTIRPGSNTFPMNGNLTQTGVTSSMDSDGMVQMIITGQEAVYNGQHLLYYETALKSNKLSLKMNVKQIISDSVKS